MINNLNYENKYYYAEDDDVIETVPSPDSSPMTNNLRFENRYYYVEDDY
jgi:hypothetical protein